MPNKSKGLYPKHPGEYAKSVQREDVRYAEDGTIDISHEAMTRALCHVVNEWQTAFDRDNTPVRADTIRRIMFQNKEVLPFFLDKEDAVITLLPVE